MTTSTEEAVDKAEAKRLAQQGREAAAAIAERRALSDAGFPQGCDVVIDTPRQRNTTAGLARSRNGTTARSGSG